MKNMRHEMKNNLDKKGTKIFMRDTIPSRNKGEAAILAGILESFKILGDVEVSICSFYPTIDAARYGEKIKIIPIIHPSEQPRIVKAFRFSLFQRFFFLIIYKIFGIKIKNAILKECCTSDLIILGHDNVCGGGCGLNAFFCKLLGKPVMVYAGTIGPFKNSSSRILTKIVLNKVDLITLREEMSYKFLKEIGVKTPMYVTADPAFLLQPVSPEKAKKIMAQENINKNGLMVGMTMSRRMAYYAFPHLKNFEEKYDKFIKLMASVVDYLTDKLNATVVFIPHVIGPGIPHVTSQEADDDDRIVAEDIYKIAKNKHKIKVIHTEYTPEELKGLIGQFDLVTGERMHSIIASTSMCVPSIAISCPPPRVHGIIGKMMGQEEYVLDIEKLDYDTYLSKINNILSNKEKVRKDLSSKAEEVKKRALLNGKLAKNLLDSLKMR